MIAVIAIAAVAGAQEAPGSLLDKAVVVVQSTNDGREYRAELTKHLDGDFMAAAEKLGLDVLVGDRVYALFPANLGDRQNHMKLGAQFGALSRALANSDGWLQMNELAPELRNAVGGVLRYRAAFSDGELDNMFAQEDFTFNIHPLAVVTVTDGVRTVAVTVPTSRKRERGQVMAPRELNASEQKRFESLQGETDETVESRITDLKVSILTSPYRSVTKARLSALAVDLVAGELERAVAEYELQEQALLDSMWPDFQDQIGRMPGDGQDFQELSPQIQRRIDGFVTDLWEDLGFRDQNEATVFIQNCRVKSSSMTPMLQFRHARGTLGFPISWRQ